MCAYLILMYDNLLSLAVYNLSPKCAVPFQLINPVFDVQLPQVTVAWQWHEFTYSVVVYSHEQIRKMMLP
jgi:hypothetical protein